MAQELRLDGNAIGGLFREVFAWDLTAARAACAGCGATEYVGAEHVYTQAPGAVVRCSHCDNVLIVLVHGGGRYVLAFQGLKWLEIREQP